MPQFSGGGDRHRETSLQQPHRGVPYADCCTDCAGAQTCRGVPEEVNRCIFQTEASAESLERNDFSWGFLSKHDGRGRNTTIIVGMLREKAKATEFWDSADTIFTSVGKVEAGTEAAATVVGKASDIGTKAYHVLPHFFEVDLVIEIPPPLSGGGKHLKFYRFEIPQHASVRLNQLRPGDPLFLINPETDDLIGAWMMTAVDVPPDRDGSEATEELLSSFPDKDALAAYFSVDPAAPPPPRGWTRWAYTSYMGSYEDADGAWMSFFIPEAEFRAIRYHVMEHKPGASGTGEGKYTLRELRAHESPAAMFGTPAFYPIKRKPGALQISLYSEYFSMLAGRLPPDPFALVKDGKNLRFLRWFPDFIVTGPSEPLPPGPSAEWYVFTPGQPRIDQLINMLNAGGATALGDNVFTYVMQDLPRLITNPPLTGASLRKYSGFVTQVGQLTSQWGHTTAPHLNLQMIAAFN
ncbi:hypothetical protein KFL_012420015, partial [Klebsormidium nitens]